MSDRDIDSHTPITDKGKDAIIIEDYNEEENDLPLQLAITASLTDITDKGQNVISIEENDDETEYFLKPAIRASLTTSDYKYVDIYDSDDDDLVAFSAQPPKTHSRKQEKPLSCNSMYELGMSSNSKSNEDPNFVCEICVEPKNPNDYFNIKGCSHVYCTDCVIKYVDSKLEENFTSINCPKPNCKCSLEPEDCHGLLPKEILESWGDALCQGIILGHESLHCPYKDCSMVLILDGEKQDVKESECPYCHRLFCAQCKAPWHSEIECGEFHRLHKDEVEREDIMLMKFVQNNKWTRYQDSIYELGMSSNSKSNEDPNFVCEICVEPKNPNDYFNIKGCSHVYCTDCIIKYVASKLEENFTSINCPEPNCKGSLEPEDCHGLLPKEILESWGDALCQGIILGHESLHCPYKDCSMVLILDGEKQDVKESECPYCHRLFCAQCKAPWHSEIECGEFQRLHKDEREREDIMLMKLVKDNKWTRCPTCRFVIEKTQGCRYIKCRCGTAFCYNCTSKQVDQYHFCHNCRG